MGRLIDADALIKYFFRPYSNEESYSNIDIENVIDDAPTIEERKTGKWILDNLNNGYGMVYHCTECNWLTTNPQYAYCPNCGARMMPELIIPEEIINSVLGDDD